MIVNRRELIGNETIVINGSKSLSNRLLILQSLYENIRLDGLSTAKDTQILQEALRSQNSTIDVHHAGTCMRFLIAYFSLFPNKTTVITGSDRMKERPIFPLVNALRELGVKLEYQGKEGYPPLKIIGQDIVKSNVTINASISSQFITALMLIGAKLPNGLVIKLKGELTSTPYLEMTSQVLKEVGIENQWNSDEIIIKPYKETTSRLKYIRIESDWSSASYYYSLCAIGKKSINIRSFKTNSLQGDAKVKDLYWRFFGVNTITDSSQGTLSLLFNKGFTYPELIDLNMNDCPDIAQTICVTAALLKIPFVITGLKTLKIKETDRLKALQKELSKIGCITGIAEDRIWTEGFVKVSDQNIYINTYNDHRMAMAFSPTALLYDVEIENKEVVEKSYPNFWEDLFSISQPRNS